MALIGIFPKYVYTTLAFGQSYVLGNPLPHLRIIFLFLNASQ